MNILKRSQSDLCPLHIISYKQRLVALVERFGADIGLCLVRQGQEWSVVGEESRLSTQWQTSLVKLTVEQTLAEGKGTRFVAELGRGEGHGFYGGTVMSALLQNKSVIFVAAKRLSSGIYKQEDVKSLGQFIEAFEKALI